MENTALLVSDLQEAMRAGRDAGFAWANPDAPETAGGMLAAFRAAGLPVVHVHDGSSDPADGLHPAPPLCAATSEVAPQASEPLVVKTGASGFIGTGLEQALRAEGIKALVIVGAEANMCVESTAHMAGNPGFKTIVVADARVSFQLSLRDGQELPPRSVPEMSLANLTSFARIADSAAVLSPGSAQS